MARKNPFREKFSVRGKTFCAPGEPASGISCCGFSFLGKKSKRGNRLISIQLLMGGFVEGYETR